MPNLKNKVCIITGAASGIGQATAVHFASLGAFVSLVDLDGDNLKKTRQMCIDQGLEDKQVLMVIGNLIKADDQERVVQETVDHFGKLDILVNCAGLFRSDQYASTSTMEEVDFMMDIIFKSGLRLIQLCLPHLKLTKGAIVNVSSLASKLAAYQCLPYSVAKCSVDQMTRCAAKEFAEFKIRVNSVNPGVVETNIYRNMPNFDPANFENLKEQCQRTTPLGRIGQADDIAKGIAFLASDDASFITGINLLIDGGSLLNFV